MSDAMVKDNREENVVGRAHVGTNAYKALLSEKHTLEFTFNDFEGLPNKRDESTTTSSLMCHGYYWKLRLNPGGDVSSNKSEVNLSVYLSVDETQSKALSLPVKAKYSIQMGPTSHSCQYEFIAGGGGFGYSDFAERSDVLDPTNGYLTDNGALIVKVGIQVYMKERSHWVPKDNLQAGMLELLKSSKRADVVFVVGDRKFPSHCNILSFRAPVLEELAENASSQEVPIPGVSPDLFGVFLHFVYGSEMPPHSYLRDNARELLELSDRYGCTNLKLLVESEVVHSIINPENVADWVLFADSHSCALLKEAAIDIINMHPNLVMETEEWKQVEESPVILRELWQAINTTRASANGIEIENMDVSTLRKKLEELGLGVDGSREMLVSSLKKESD